jgi:hypothetical protein
MKDDLDPSLLKEKQRRLRTGFSEPLTLRVHRALSWLSRASVEEDDVDVRFILLWIGFNAAYAADVNQAPDRERGRFREFFSTMIAFDTKHRIYDTVWKRFPNEIRLLLDNPYVFAPFWHHYNGVPGYADWKLRLDRSRVAIHNALRQTDTATILSILFDRIYVLRNQIVHGGATWNSEINRKQVKDGAALLHCLLPLFIDLMMDHPTHPWPKVYYPVVRD